MAKLEQFLLEPVNALTHFAGAVLSLIGLLVLVNLTWHDRPKMLTMIIYGLALIFVYGASALLHGIKTSEANRMRLNRLDHSAIFLLIAGTYTPVAYNVFPEPWRWSLLGLVWILSALGATYKMLNDTIHGFLNTFVYVFLGWASALPFFLVAGLIPLALRPGLLLMLLGGIIITAGYLVYYLQRPDPWPKRLGHHEIWHLFVMVGTTCHFLFILWYIVPFERVAAT